MGQAQYIHLAGGEMGGGGSGMNVRPGVVSALQQFAPGLIQVLRPR